MRIGSDWITLMAAELERGMWLKDRFGGVICRAGLGVCVGGGE